MKKKIKKMICLLLRIIIPIISLVPKNKASKNIREYEKTLKKLYNPQPFEFKKHINKENNHNIDLSIIIPVYNSEDYLWECLDSIHVNKTNYTYEIICINDGSTDKSLEILEKFKKKYKNIVIINQENNGAASARNKGLDNATGKYVAFIDCDDYIADNYIEVLLNIAYENNNDIVKCGYYRTFENRIEKVEGMTIKCNKGLKGNILNIEGFLCMGIIKRSLLYDIRLPEGYWYEDMITRPLILSRCNNYVGIKDCLYYYRQHSNNISKTVEHSKDYRCLSQYYLANYIIKYAANLNVNIDEHFKIAMMREYGIMSYSRLNKLEKNIRKKIFYLSSQKIQNLNLERKKIISFSDKYFYQSFVKENYLLYTLISKYEKWK